MINWFALLVVQLVSIGATLALVVLISLAVLGLSAHGDARVPVPITRRHVATLTARSGVVVGALCLALAAAVVLLGLWVIVA